MADKTLASLVFPGLPDRYVVPDNSADIEQIKEDLSSLESAAVPHTVKTALLDVLAAAVYTTDVSESIAVLNSWKNDVISVSIDRRDVSITDVQTIQLNATTNPPGLLVGWSSSDTSIATVDSTGLVTAVAVGNANITATCESKTARCHVTVTESAALYPLTNGEITLPSAYYGGRTITVTNGNHIDITFPNEIGSPGRIVNLSDLQTNTTANANANGANVNNLTNIMFTIPQGANVKFKIRIDKTLDELFGETKGEFKIGLRKTNSSDNVFKTLGYNVATETLDTVETMLEEANASCLFLYASRIPAETVVGIDVSLIVNGVKWI